MWYLESVEHTESVRKRICFQFAASTMPGEMEEFLVDTIPAGNKNRSICWNRKWGDVTWGCPKTSFLHHVLLRSSWTEKVSLKRGTLAMNQAVTGSGTEIRQLVTTGRDRSSEEWLFPQRPVLAKLPQQKPGKLALPVGCFCISTIGNHKLQHKRRWTQRIRWRCQPDHLRSSPHNIRWKLLPSTRRNWGYCTYNLRSRKLSTHDICLHRLWDSSNCSASLPRAASRTSKHRWHRGKCHIFVCFLLSAEPLRQTHQHWQRLQDWSRHHLHRSTVVHYSLHPYHCHPCCSLPKWTMHWVKPVTISLVNGLWATRSGDEDHAREPQFFHFQRVCVHSTVQYIKPGLKHKLTKSRSFSLLPVTLLTIIWLQRFGR